MIQIMCLVEHVFVPSPLLKAIIKFCGCDVRSVLMQLQFWFDQGKDPLFQSWKKEPQQGNGEFNVVDNDDDIIANSKCKIGAKPTKINIVVDGDDNANDANVGNNSKGDIARESKEDAVIATEEKVVIGQETMMDVDNLSENSNKKEGSLATAKMAQLKCFPVHKESKLFDPAEVRIYRYVFLFIIIFIVDSLANL